MMRGIRQIAVVSSALALLGALTAGSALGDPILLSVNANYLDGDFCCTGGCYGNGCLSVCDNADIVVEYDTGQVTYAGGHFAMITPLYSDNSVGGCACGVFQTGTIAITDALDDNLLTANLVSLQLDEVFDGCGLLAGTGLFEVTGGSLEEDFGFAYGKAVQISFCLSCDDISDFSGDFCGISNITLMPIPEPATVSLLGAGLLLALGWTRLRRLR